MLCQFTIGASYVDVQGLTLQFKLVRKALSTLSYPYYVTKRDLLLYFPFLIPFCCVQYLFGKCSWTYIFYLCSDIDFGKSLGKHGDSTLFIAKQKQQRISWLITGVRKIFCVQVEVGLNCSTMLAYFVFIEMQMKMNTDYGKILIVFGLIVPVRMNLVMVQKPE